MDTADLRFVELLEFHFSGWANMTMELHQPLDAGVHTPTTLMGPGWACFSLGLTPWVGGELRCTLAETDDPCLVVGNDGRTIVLGFLADVPMAEGGERLFSNIIEFFNIPYMSADPQDSGIGIMGVGGWPVNASEDRGCLADGNSNCQ